jgi:restriction system protein
MADANYYELLRLEPSATAEEIKAAYRRLSSRVHPDAGGSEALFRQVNLAYETLSDPARREIYDRNGYVEPGIQSSGASAPGWRRTDDKPPKKPGPKAKPKADPTSSSHDESSDEQPPPRSPPPPPPPAHDQSATHSDGETGATSSALRRRVAAYPSWALLAAGVLIIVVGGRTFLFLGFVAAVVGFVGVLGRKKAAHRAAMQRANIVSIDLMTGTEFEQRLRAAFEQEGYIAYHIGGRGDFGADLVLDAPGTRIVVQAKRWSQSVGPGAVQEVVASRAHYGAHRAIVVTNSNFTKAAIELARSNDVEMWDRSRLIDFLATQDLGPARKGGGLLADELKAGAPTAFKGVLVVFLGVLAAAATGSKSGRKRKRRR